MTTLEALSDPSEELYQHYATCMATDGYGEFSSREAAEAFAEAWKRETGGQYTVGVSDDPPHNWLARKRPELSRPDLSRLDPKTLRNVLVAEKVYGYTWVAESRWRLFSTTGNLVASISADGSFNNYGRLVASISADGSFNNYGLPDYEGDPAASWNLMVNERIQVSPLVCATGEPQMWSADPNPHGAVESAHYSTHPGAALVDAVLAKYNVEVLG